MLEKLLKIRDEYLSIEKQLADPNVFSDQKKYVELNRKYKSLKNLFRLAENYINLEAQKKEAEELLTGENDDDIKELAKDQLHESKEKLSVLEEEAKNCTSSKRSG
jgi:peptide chain release factor 1